MPWWRLPVVGAATAIALLTGAGAASACSCLQPENREAAVSFMSRYDVVFEGTVIRTFPGTAVYAVADVYTGDVSERILTSAGAEGSSCAVGTPSRGETRLFLGTSKSGVISASEGGMCAYSITAFEDGGSARLRELATEAHGPPNAPQATFGSRALTAAEWPLTWFADRRVWLGIVLIAAVAYLVHYYRSRYGDR